MPRECRFCHVVFFEDDPCNTIEDAAGCPFSEPLGSLPTITAEPMEPFQLKAMQDLIDDGSISAIVRHTGSTSWARVARLLIAGGKCHPPRTKCGKADYANWGQEDS
jgi:hypothetical protein